MLEISKPGREKWIKSLGVVVHMFNPSAPETEAEDLWELVASLIYIVSAKADHSTQ